MKTEAALRNTKRPGDKLGEFNGNPNMLVLFNGDPILVQYDADDGRATVRDQIRNAVSVGKHVEWNCYIRED